MLNADDGDLPSRFAGEVIFDDGFVCVAARESNRAALLAHHVHKVLLVLQAVVIQ